MPQTHFHRLKEKQRAIRGGFPQSLGLRVHRAISWLGRAEQEAEDADVRFVLLWIGFNSAYAAELRNPLDGERQVFNQYFEALVALDPQRNIYNAVWQRFPHEIRLLLDNKFVFAPFWCHQNTGALPGWADSFAASRRAIASAMAKRDTATILSVLFDRLYVLRNQLVHGGATWNGSVNRAQVRDGAAILGSLLPVFIEIMMDNPARDWGRPFYPVVE